MVQYRAALEEVTLLSVVTAGAAKEAAVMEVVELVAVALVQAWEGVAVRRQFHQ